MNGFTIFSFHGTTWLLDFCARLLPWLYRATSSRVEASQAGSCGNAQWLRETGRCPLRSSPLLAVSVDPSLVGRSLCLSIASTSEYHPRRDFDGILSLPKIVNASVQQSRSIRFNSCYASELKPLHLRKSHFISFDTTILPSL